MSLYYNHYCSDNLISYNAALSKSGNITVNGILTCQANLNVSQFLTVRGLGAGAEEGVDLNTPPYAIHNGLLTVLFFTVHRPRQVLADFPSILLLRMRLMSTVSSS